jgi:SAM-dependent methyltransferase
VEGAEERSAEFDAIAAAYDRYRPRYPPALFADLVSAYGLELGDRVVEIGAGTGIATLPPVECGLQVTAIEPVAGMVSLLEAKVGHRAEVVNGRFEEFPVERTVELVASFNSWHWVDPLRGVERLFDLLAPTGVVALVWGEVISWGEEPFEKRLVDLSGAPWIGRIGEVVDTKHAVESDVRFTKLAERRYRSERRLDAGTFAEVTRTYGRPPENLLVEIEALINAEFGGAVTKVEEAVVYAYQRH